jgi:hypothetical protein
MNNTVKYILIFTVMVGSMLGTFATGCCCFMLWEGSIAQRSVNKLCEYQDKRRIATKKGG